MKQRVMAKSGSIASVSAALVASIVGLVCSVVWFAFHQDIWLDETTQLSGMTLGPIDLVRWLTGEDQGRFGVPGDRMPPLSYLVDWAWAGLVSGSEISIRLLHAAIAIAGVLILARAVWRLIDPATAVVLTLLFALSTRFVQAAVEIRAYPLFMALTCIALALQIRIASTPRGMSNRQVVAYASVGLLLVWTHFFGVVAWFSLVAGLAWHFTSDRASLLRLAGCCGIVTLGCATLIPFAFASATLSEAIVPEKSFTDVALYVLRLLIGSVEMLKPAAAGALLAGAAALLTTCLLCAFVAKRSRADSGSALASAVIPLGLGVGGTVAAAFVVSGFEPLKATYSLWTLPLLHLLLAWGWQVARGPAWWRNGGRHVAMSLVLGGLGTAAILQWSSPNLMIHGPHRFLQTQLGRSGEALMLYDTDNEWGYGYFPLRYSGKGAIEQWRPSDRAGLYMVQITDGPSQPAPVSLGTILKDRDSVVLTVIRPDRYGVVRTYLGGAASGITEGAVFRQLQRSQEWRLDHVAEQVGYYTAKSWTWRRQSSPAADGSPLAQE